MLLERDDIELMIMVINSHLRLITQTIEVWENNRMSPNWVEQYRKEEARLLTLRDRLKSALFEPMDLQIKITIPLDCEYN